MKRSILHDEKGLARLLERINSDPEFQPHLRKSEPDWASEISKYGLSEGMEQELVASLKLLWVLPFADAPTIRELLLFRYTELPIIEEQFKKAKDRTGLRFVALYVLLLRMLLQGNSIVPQSTTHLANRLRLTLKTPSAERESLTPLLHLFIGKDLTASTGKNFAEVADLESVVISEHQRREGTAEGGWKNNKFELYRQELSESPEFRQDWERIKQRFNLEKFRDSSRIIRRTATPERNWQRPTHPEMEVTKDRFQVTFDFFCWKWFLYGMRNDEPLIEKLTYTLTPYGTQIFIPGYWSLDYVRDVNWREVLKLHRARGIHRQGQKLINNLKAQREQLARLKGAEREAGRLKLRGKARYQHLKQKAGFAQTMDDSQLRRLLRKTD